MNSFDDFNELTNAIASVLPLIEISDNERKALKLLYDQPAGVPYRVDSMYRVQGPSVDACKRVGSRIMRALNSKYFDYGMHWVGTTDLEEPIWRMTDEFRAAATAIGFFGEAQSNGDQLADMHREFDLQVQRSSSDTASARAARLATADPMPKKVQMSTYVFIRNYDVVAQTRANAAGKCQGCGSLAPFIGRNGQPFLEVHHRVKLADGGPDTVKNAIALCPNCHRKSHYG